RVVDRIGHTLASYRTQVAALAAALAVSFVAVGCQVVAFYMATKAFPLPAATLLEQAVIVPVAALSNVVPLPVNGLGLLDFAMSWLTEQVTLGRIAAAEVMLALLAIRAAQMVMVLTALWLYSAPFAGRNSAAAAS
ncbi:MAG TPA: hypothetical protein VEB21_13135, partial [Terriglobales bacterium]|nr:hypothetical protein [Terriglobales bacterium]